MQLEEMQEQALSKLDPETGHFALSDRYDLWRSMGELASQEGEHTAPHEGRVSLFLKCMQMMMPFWRKCERKSQKPLLNPEDAPKHTIHVAESWLHDELETESLRETAERLQDLDQYVPEIQEVCFNAGLISSAACSLLWNTLHDKAFEVGNEEDSDALLCDLLCCWVYVGAPPWEKDPSGKNALKRRRFWTWYINDAYTKAWQVAHPQG